MAEFAGSAFIVIRADDQTQAAFKAVADQLQRMEAAAAQASAKARISFAALRAAISKVSVSLAVAAKTARAFGQTLVSIGARMSAVGASMVAAGVGAAASVMHTANSLDELGKAAQRAGVSVRVFAELSFAAKQAGVDASALEKALSVLSVNMHKARRGNKEVAASLLAVGISAEQIARGDVAGAFTALARRTATANDRVALAGRLSAVLGQRYRELLPLLAGGAVGLEEAAAAAHRLGAVPTDEAVASATQFSDAVGELKTALVSLLQTAIVPLLPTITAWVQKVTAIVISVREWIAANQDVVMAIGAVVAAITGLGAGMVVLGPVAAAVGMLASAFGSLLGVLSSILGPLAAFVGAGAATVGVSTAAAAGMAALTDRTSQFGTSMKAAGQSFVNVWSDGLAGIQTIWNALKAGRWKDALTALKLTFKLVWHDIWSGFRNFVDGIGATLLSSIIDGVGQALDWVLDKVGWAVEKLGSLLGIDWLQGAGTSIRDFGKSLKEGAKDLAAAVDETAEGLRAEREKQRQSLLRQLDAVNQRIKEGAKEEKKKANQEKKQELPQPEEFAEAIKQASIEAHGAMAGAIQRIFPATAETFVWRKPDAGDMLGGLGVAGGAVRPAALGAAVKQAAGGAAVPAETTLKDIHGELVLVNKKLGEIHATIKQKDGPAFL